MDKPQENGHVVNELPVISRNYVEIPLVGYPYNRELPNKELVSSTEALEELAINANYAQRVEALLPLRNLELAPLFELGYHGLDALVKDPTVTLSFEQAYSLITFVCMASNRYLRAQLMQFVPGYSQGAFSEQTLLLHAVSLLQGMSVRESLVGLTSDEIAGMVMATTELDTVARPEVSFTEPTLAVGGMGGDRGLYVDGNKTKFFSISTLGSLNSANFGMVHKHDSYPNTSAMSGQLAREALGARSDFRTNESMVNTMLQSNYLGSSCHSTRTLHTISHILKGETINHVIGPAAFPQAAEDPMIPMIGVNHNIPTEVYAAALATINERRGQRFVGGVVFCGTDIYADGEVGLEDVTGQRVILDEVAPPPYYTKATFITPDGLQSVLIGPDDFMTKDQLKIMTMENLAVENNADNIAQANQDVINGLDLPKMQLVAMTTALAIFAKDFAHQAGSIDAATNRVDANIMRYCFNLALDKIKSGELAQVVQNYVAASSNVR